MVVTAVAFAALIWPGPLLLSTVAFAGMASSVNQLCCKYLYVQLPFLFLHNLVLSVSKNRKTQSDLEKTANLKFE